MNNIKKIALGLTVATFALGFSAFKTAEKRVSATYYQTSNNLYEKITSASGDCETSTPTRPCSIFYAVDPGVAPFVYANRPANGVDSEDKTLFHLDP